MIIDENYLDSHMSREDSDSHLNQNKYFKRPKLKINRLSEEKKIVPLEIDIQVNEKFILRERFDWNLEDSNVSPARFAELFVEEIGVPEHNKESIKNQIWTQIIDHIEKNTAATLQKTKTGRFGDLRENFSFSVNQPPEIEDDRDLQKQTERQKVIGEMKKKSYALSKNSAYLDTKKICNYCENSQIIASVICRSCKMPYKITDQIPKMTEREVLAIKFLEQLMKQIDVVAEADLDQLVDVEDFSSTYFLKNSLIARFASYEDVITHNIYHPIANAIQSIYDEFIADQRKKKMEEEVSSNKELQMQESGVKETPKPIENESDSKKDNSDADRDANDDEDDKDEEERASAKKQDPLRGKTIRKRGRPKKVIIPKRFSLLQREKPELNAPTKDS